MTKFPISTFSWIIFSNNVFIKSMDKSVYLHSSSGIPMAIKKYWEIEKMKSGQRKSINIDYEGQKYKFSINIDNKNRAKLSWSNDFNTILYHRFKSIIEQYKYDDVEENNIKNEMRFNKLSNVDYEVEFIDNLIIDDNEEDNYWIKEETCFIEGRRIMQFASRYERSSAARKEAINIHGCTCKICRFDFEKKYGEIGSGYIEIHHKKPLYINAMEIPLNANDDLVPVCSNCHRMIHRKKDKVLSVDELRKMIQF